MSGENGKRPPSWSPKLNKRPGRLIEEILYSLSDEWLDSKFNQYVYRWLTFLFFFFFEILV